MSAVKAGDTVEFHYKGTLNDGTQFDSSHGRNPMSVEVGAGSIIPGLEAALPGMQEGETKQVKVPAADAYGPVNPEAVQAVPRDQIPDHIPLDLGTQLQLQMPDGRQVAVTVAEVTPQSVTLDANHPLAGQDLNFEIEVVRIAA